MRARTLGAALLALPFVAAGALPGLSVQPGSRVWVDGSSNTSFWHCVSDAPRGSADAGTTDPARIAVVRRAEIVVPVATLECGNQTMNEHLLRALRADAAPEIRFRPRSVRLVRADGGWTATLSGRLSVGGRARRVTVHADVAGENGGLRVRGRKTLRMTDWGVAPPTLMMRSVVVDPGVTV
ncbi:MAG TPA: YceI family protein, partial [Longimicrobium sp.]|nr:YceI family protein [Longimicrobium sp.]